MVYIVGITRNYFFHLIPHITLQNELFFVSEVLLISKLTSRESINRLKLKVV